MSVSLPRGQVSTHLIGVLAATSLPVGDAEPPTALHGWQGEPNAAGSNFIPWLTLGTGSTTISSGSLGFSQEDWRATYFLTIAGVTRKQTESVADGSRSLLVGVHNARVITSSGNWKIQQIRAAALGAVVRLTDINPPYFIQTDTYEVWLSKETA